MEPMDPYEWFRAMLSPSGNPPMLNKIILEEEAIHPWLPGKPLGQYHYQYYPSPPLGASYSLRVIDDQSRAQLHEEARRIDAEDQTWKLDTREERHNALALHADKRRWERPSPFISADTSVLSTIERARRQQRKNRGRVRVVLINNKVRQRAGFPFFGALEEMKYYGVEDPYGLDYRWYRTEILYPYVITAEEIVAVVEWASIDEYLEKHSTRELIQGIEAALDQHESAALGRWIEEHPVLNFRTR